MSEETMLTETATTPEGTVNDNPAGASSTADDKTSQTKTDDSKDSKSGDQKPAGDTAPKTGAPESYTFTPPEGAQLDTSVIEEFSKTAKELNLPQAEAQKVIDKMVPVLRARHTAQIQAARQEWAAAAQSDKEFGGEKIAENIGYAKKALDQFGTPELKSLLNESGLGNHPEVIRLLYRAGKSIGEDGFVAGGSVAGRADDIAARMYPNEAKRG